MANQNRVIATLIQTAVNRVSQIDRLQGPGGFERKRLIFGKDEIAFVSWLDRLKHIHRLTILVYLTADDAGGTQGKPVLIILRITAASSAVGPAGPIYVVRF